MLGGPGCSKATPHARPCFSCSRGGGCRAHGRNEAGPFTSLGFGDVTPSGPLRLLAGMEALNGLLLIGWSASYIHLAMERFWPVAGWPQSAAARSERRARSAARGPVHKRRGHGGSRP
jgi:hypothetical protein